MKIKKFTESTFSEENKEEIQEIQDIIEKHYGDDIEYVGELDRDDFIKEKTTQMTNQISSDLKDNNIEYIDRYINYDWIENEVWESLHKYVKIGSWVWNIESCGDDANTFIHTICYDDNDRTIIEDHGAISLDN